jgi:hypothetical protein
MCTKGLQCSGISRYLDVTQCVDSRKLCMPRWCSLTRYIGFTVVEVDVLAAFNFELDQCVVEMREPRATGLIFFRD